MQQHAPAQCGRRFRTFPGSPPDRKRSQGPKNAAGRKVPPGSDARQRQWSGRGGAGRAGGLREDEGCEMNFGLHRVVLQRRPGHQNTVRWFRPSEAGSPATGGRRWRRGVATKGPEGLERLEGLALPVFEAVGLSASSGAVQHFSHSTREGIKDCSHVFQSDRRQLNLPSRSQ
jgi:hypothetical protein